MKQIFFTLAMIFVATVSNAGCDEKKQINALALNMYHEARGEGSEAMQLVGEVTLNRVENKNFPDNICEVVYQSWFDSKGNPKRHKCQFSWFCDGESDKPYDKEAWAESVGLATGLVKKTISFIGVTATHYHTTDVKPFWAKEYVKVGKYGKHVFYMMKDNKL